MGKIHRTVDIFTQEIEIRELLFYLVNGNPSASSSFATDDAGRLLWDKGTATNVTRHT